MTMRSNMLGRLVLGTLLAGCGIFDDPPTITEDSETTGDATTGGVTSTTPTTDPTTTMPTTVEPTTDPTTVDPTTMGSVDDTTSTTSEVSATDSTGSSSTTGEDPCVAACAGLACGMADTCDCGACGPMSQCAADQTYCAMPVGYFADFGYSQSLPGSVQLGYRFQVFAPTVVRRLGLISWGAGATVRLALYDHDGAGPNNRLVQTGAVMLYANGNNEFDVGATAIAPGDYWVMLHTQGSTPMRSTPNGVTNYEEALRNPIPFASGFPSPMVDELVLQDYAYNVYMVVEE